MGVRSIKTCADTVREILAKHPDARDSYESLYSIYLYKHMIRESGLNAAQLDDKGVLWFLKQMREGNLPKYESIGRASRKLQEECPELRGEKWAERQQEAEKVAQAVRSGTLIASGGGVQGSLIVTPSKVHTHGDR